MPSKHILLTVACSLGVASAAWCADEPAQPAEQAAQAQQATEASRSANDAAAKAPAAKKAAEADAEEKRLLARGYKKEIHNGETFYCRYETKMGSRFETKQCGTVESMNQAEQQARDLMQNRMRAAGSK